MKDKTDSQSTQYWLDNLSLTFKLPFVWFSVSFGAAIIFQEALDQFSIGGAPLGFWMAQQGSIICFVILLFVYSFLMNKLDQKHGYGEESE